MEFINFDRKLYNLIMDDDYIWKSHLYITITEKESISRSAIITIDKGDIASLDKDYGMIMGFYPNEVKDYILKREVKKGFFQTEHATGYWALDLMEIYPEYQEDKELLSLIRGDLTLSKIYCHRFDKQIKPVRK